MAILPIIKIGHPTLRKVAQPVQKFDEQLAQTVENMIETMRLNEGIGLAAPQVGISERYFVIDLNLIDDRLEAKAYINPEILETEGSEKIEEGCLSIPGIRADVIRPERIKVKYQTVTGDLVEEVLDDYPARVFQHENDHLNGVLFVDIISPLRKKLLAPKLLELEGAN